MALYLPFVNFFVQSHFCPGDVLTLLLSLMGEIIISQVFIYFGLFLSVYVLLSLIRSIIYLSCLGKSFVRLIDLYLYRSTWVFFLCVFALASCDSFFHGVSVALKFFLLLVNIFICVF